MGAANLDLPSMREGGNPTTSLPTDTKAGKLVRVSRQTESYAAFISRQTTSGKNFWALADLMSRRKELKAKVQSLIGKKPKWSDGKIRCCSAHARKRRTRMLSNNLQQTKCYRSVGFNKVGRLADRNHSRKNPRERKVSGVENAVK